MDTPLTLRLHEKNVRIVSHNRRIQAKIREKTQKVIIRGEGAIIGQTMALHWDGSGHDDMITRIARGLYFHTTGSPLPLDVIIRGSFQQAFDGDLLRLWNDLDGENIGANGEFRYRFGRAAEDPTYSVWMMTFFDRHFAAAQTGDWKPRSG